MKKRIILSISAVMFITLTTMTVHQSASASQEGLNLMFDSIEALALGESSAHIHTR